MPTESLPLTSFPLERPTLRARRRDGRLQPNSLPWFIAGPENRFAAFLAVSDTPLAELGNPLLLIGPSGSGKTVIALHVAARQAAIVGNPDAEADRKPASVQYWTATDFARQYAEAVNADDLPPLRRQIRTAGVLILDDLHQIADKPAAQEELALRIESRTERGLPTVVTCRRLPSEIRGMRPALASRVLPGLTVPLVFPQDQARLQLLRELCAVHEVPLDDALLDALHQQLNSNLPARSLDAAVKQIALWCRMDDQAPSIATVRKAAEVVGDQRDLSPSVIAQAVARQYRMKLTELRSKSRKQNLVRARSLAMLLTRRLTSLSMHQIGEYFGGRDHTTVLHAIRKTEALLQDDPELRRTADEVRETLIAA